MILVSNPYKLKLLHTENTLLHTSTPKAPERSILSNINKAKNE